MRTYSVRIRQYHCGDHCYRLNVQAKRPIAAVRKALEELQTEVRRLLAAQAHVPFYRVEDQKFSPVYRIAHGVFGTESFEIFISVGGYGKSVLGWRELA